MAQFRKKPVEIEAFEATIENLNDYEGWPQWLKDAFQKPFEEAGAFYFLASAPMISTLEGQLSVSLNDWIIRGVKGEIYPCKPDIFAATYDQV